MTRSSLVPELPSHTVEVHRAWAKVVGRLKRVRPDDVADLPEDHGAVDPDLEQRRRGALARRAEERSARREEASGTVFVPDRREEAEVSCGKTVQETGLDVHLRPRLILRP